MFSPHHPLTKPFLVLDEKVTVLEQAIFGNSSAENREKNLSLALSQTSRKLRLLDRGALENLGGSLKSLKQQVDQTMDVVEGFDAKVNEKMDAKINELWEMCHTVLEDKVGGRGR